MSLQSHQILVVCGGLPLLLRRISGAVSCHFVECRVQHVNSAEITYCCSDLLQRIPGIHQLGIRELHLILNGDADQVQGRLAVSESVDGLLGNPLGNGLHAGEQQLRAHFPAAGLTLRHLGFLNDAHAGPYPSLIHLGGEHAARQVVGVFVGGDRESQPQRLSQLQNGLGVLVPGIIFSAVFLLKLLNRPLHPSCRLTVLTGALSQLTSTLLQGGLPVAESGNTVVLDPFPSRPPTLSPG
mmetsp:Transcript_37020/g.80888  ORF Transcript_37020/g.80888 Transcript_37020/m.80888 type:complete len:240 (-) Transcript_37020:326-1045(-)